MRSLVGVAAVLAVWAAFGQDTWTFEKPYVWARDGGAVTLTRDGAAFRVAHTGGRDWALAGFPRIAVRPGELIEMDCRVRLEAREEASAETGVVLRDEQGRERSWSFGGMPFGGGSRGGWRELRSRFVVPKGVASVEPRLIGWAAATVWAEGYTVRRIGNVLERVRPGLPPRFEIARDGLTVAFERGQGCLEATDRRTGRVWRQDWAGAGWMVLDFAEEGPAPAAGVRVTLLDPESVREVRVRLGLEAGGELRVTVDAEADGPLARPLDFPPPFDTRKGDRLIVPMNEGVGYPVDEEHAGLWRLIAYGGHGICMGFFGVAEDASGAGWMCILETSDDAAMDARKAPDGLWRAGPSWDAQKGRFGYPRQARYVFFDKGGHVAMCARYREHARRTGLLVPFTEKVRRNPKIDLLLGAANIWNWDAQGRKAEWVAELQAAGLERILWSGGGSAEELKALNALPKVLTGRYDIYQDIMDPAQFDRLRYRHSDWVTAAFPHDINWKGPDGDWRRGWEIELKEGEGMVPCAVICDARAVPYARARIAAELAAKPYGARFIDTTVAAPWFECYHPDHPMTRTDSRRHKMELLKLIGEFGLVCGSETGHEASVPFCDYFEGMLSLGNYRVPDAGRHMERVLDTVPEAVAKYQVGEAYRLPLWELVYHDCVVAHWYWGDYNNKLPAIWRKRDLFNALYGTPPMYMLSLRQWGELKERVVESYRVAAPVARATGYAAMTDHRFLTPDRRVQQTVFANGVTVTVNFSERPYAAPGGVTIPPLDRHVTGL